MGLSWFCRNHLWPWTSDLDLAKLVAAAVIYFLMLCKPVWVCGSAMMGSCVWARHSTHVTIWFWNYVLERGKNLRDIEKNLKAPSVADVLVCGLSIRVGLHGYVVLPQWPLTLDIWPWPFKSCGSCFVQHIYNTLASLDTWTTHEMLG